MRISPPGPRRLVGLVVATCALLLAAAVPRRADAATPEVGGDLVVDGNTGDQVLHLTFSDGSQQDISAGNGVTLALGGGVIFFDEGKHELEVVATIGAKYSTMAPTQNASLDWVRVPIELLAFYRSDAFHFRVGGGGTIYALNHLSGSGVLSPLDVHFTPAAGAVVQADFVWKGFFAGLRYTIMRYHASTSDVSISADSFGVDGGFFYRLFKL